MSVECYICTKKCIEFYLCKYIQESDNSACYQGRKQSQEVVVEGAFLLYILWYSESFCKSVLVSPRLTGLGLWTLPGESDATLPCQKAVKYSDEET